VHAAKHGHKLLFPTFDVSRDPLPWLNWCDQFFRIQETPKAGKVFLATFYMSGVASQWYTLLERNHGRPSWHKFVKLVNQRFGPPLCSNTLDELIQLQRKGSVADYQSKFLSLLAKCKDLAEKHQISIFTVGLRNPLRTDVELEHPATLEHAMVLTRIYEQRLAMTRDLPTCSTTNRTSSFRPVGKPLLLPALSPPVGKKDIPAMTPRLTAVEMAAKREKGECYNYTEPFTRAHLEVCPMKGIYLLQMDDDITLVEIEEVADPLISLHAIAGLANAETMQLAVRINDYTLGASSTLAPLTCSSRRRPLASCTWSTRSALACA
jgi:hypothetical protein